jgi:hypothetical protein
VVSTGGNFGFLLLCACLSACSFQSASRNSGLDSCAGENCAPGEISCPEPAVQCDAICSGQSVTMPDGCASVTTCACPPPEMCAINEDCGEGGRCEMVCPVCEDDSCGNAECAQVCVPTTCVVNADCGAGMRCDQVCRERDCPLGLDCPSSCTASCVPASEECDGEICAEKEFCKTSCSSCRTLLCGLFGCSTSCVPEPQTNNGGGDSGPGGPGRGD